MNKATVYCFRNRLTHHERPREAKQVDACRNAGTELAAKAIHKQIPAAD